MRPGTCVLTGILALLVGCSGVAVHYDFDRHASFERLRTFGWQVAKSPAPPAERDNPIMARRLHRIVEQELSARGYALQETDPDFLVNCYPLYRNRLVQTYTAMGPGWGYGWGRPWGYAGTGVSEVQTFREGSIVLEVTDRRSQQVVWQGVADGALTGLRDPQDAEEAVSWAVKKLLGKFPPPAK